MAGNLSLFVSHEAEEDALNAAAISRADYSGDAMAINEGQIVRKGGANWYAVHSLDGFEHEAGMAGSPQLAAAATAGATSISVDGHTSSANEGDLFTITGDTQQYVVTAVSTFASGTAQTLTVSPALRQNAANDAALTVVGDHKVALMWSKDAVGTAFRQLPASEFDASDLIDYFELRCSDVSSETQTFRWSLKRNIRTSVGCLMSRPCGAWVSFVRNTLSV